MAETLSALAIVPQRRDSSRRLLILSLFVLGLAAFGAEEFDRWLWTYGRTVPVFVLGGGMCLAALLFSRPKYWALLAAAAAAGRVASDGGLRHFPWGKSVALAAAEALATVLVAALLQISSRSRRERDASLTEVWRFLGFTGAACALSAPLCAALSRGDWGAAFSASSAQSFFAGLTGYWLVTPALLALSEVRFRQPWPIGRVLEGVALFGSLAFVSLNVFAGALPVISLPSLLSMWAIWAVLRFGMVGAASAMLIIGVHALFATVREIGPFVRPDRTTAESLLRLLIYLAVWTGFLQIVAAILRERSGAVRSLADLNQELEKRVAERTQTLTRTGQALRASEERFRLAASAAGFGAYDHHVRTGELHWSPEMKAIYGMEPDAPVTGEDLLDHYYAPEDHQRMQTAYQRSLDPAGNGALAIEHRILRRDGSERWVRVSGRTIFETTEHGREPVRAVGTCTDITERKEAEEALRESENRLALAIKAGHSGTFDWDALNDTWHWSNDLLALYGTLREEAGSRYADWLDFVDPEDRALAEERLRESFSTGQYVLQFRIRRRDTGAVRWMEGRGTLLTDGHGQPARLLGINVDITDQKVVEEALRESKDQLTFVLGAVKVGVWSVDLQTGMLTASPECRQNFGVSPGDIFDSYEDVRARLHPDDLAVEAQAAAAARQRQGEYDAEYRVLWPDGSVRWILARGQIVRGGHGKPSRLSGIALDITDRKEVEQALKESESKLRGYYEAAPLFMGVVELEGDEIRHLYDNPASCRFFGVPANPGTVRRASDLGLAPETLEAWRRNYRLSEERGEPVRFELSFAMPSGHRWVSLTVLPLPAASGERPRFSYVAEDVTGRRRTETALRQHATRQATLLELTRTILSKRSDASALGVAVFQRVSGVLEADIGFNYRLMEDGVMRLVAAFGLPPEQLAAAQRMTVGEAFCGQVAESGVPMMAESACIATDPRGSFVRGLGARAYACHPLLASDGRVLGTLSFASTRRQRFEPEEVSFLQTLCHYVAIAWERSEAEAAMQQAKEAAEGASRAKDDFLAALSHELRTPLNPVLLLASELQRQPDLSEELRGDLATIRRNVELEARLIDDLLDLTRITRGKVSLDLRPVELHRVVAEALEILDSEVSAKELHLQVELAPGQPVVRADAVRLQQVFWNVLRNAIKFTPPGGKVTVRTCDLPDGRVCVEVSDTGEGIPPEHLPTIFDTFNQGEGGHRFGGLGLGLAIARSLVEMHGGEIQAASGGRGEGATFRVILPLAAERGANGRVVVRALAPEAGDAPVAGLRILLVEDHEPTRAALTRLLERRRHKVISAGTLADARGLAGRETFDLLISDLGLPDGDGTELMRHLHASGGPPGIALSGYGMDEDLQRSSGAGFFAHLVKPVDVDVLDRTLAVWASSSRLAS